MAPTNQNSRSRRHRSAVACQSCRQRKVRCSLTVTGVPCAACTQDGSDCIVDTNRAKLAQQINKPAPNLHQKPVQPMHSRLSFSPSNNQATSNPLTRESGSGDNGTRLIQSEQVTPSATSSSAADHRLGNIEEEERSGLEIASAALGQPERTGEVPYYTGERTGPTSALDICSPGHSLPKHFLIPSHRKDLSDEDRDFLRRKGVFTLPGKNACNSMIEAYLTHVHPILPVIEADILLQHHQSGQLHTYNTLLLWSLFFVAVNFIPADICEQEGYASRRYMRYDMYSRAKCMHNNGNERSNIALLQSSLLLGFWHSDIEEHTQPWYWTGIAISLGQILGLHRDPEISSYNSCITERQRKFWRRLWWCCFFRDRWLGLTLGRPLRIHLDDCDIPMPSPDDMLFDIQAEVPRENCSSSLESFSIDMQRSAEYWIILIELSCQLGRIMAMNYQAARSKPSLDDIEMLEMQLLQSRLPDQYEIGLTPSVRFYSNHIHLHYQAMLITFYRPWGTDTPSELQGEETAKKDWQHRMRLRADAAASRTNEILDALVQDNLLGFAGPMTPPLLVPAMQAHLLHCKTGDSLSKRIRLNKLEMCMLVMEELQKTYTVASIYRAVFTKAIQLIFPGYSTPVAPYYNSEPTAAATAPTAASVTGAANSPRMEADIRVSDYTTQTNDGMFGASEGELMDALMDEASIFNFWESWNQI